VSELTGHLQDEGPAVEFINVNARGKHGLQIMILINMVENSD
jgi:hypothetical protein